MLFLKILDDLFLTKLDINAINNATDPIGLYKTQIAGPVAPTTTTTTTPTTPTVTTPTQAITNTGLVTSTEANILSNSGYTAADVTNLVKAGYTASDLVELASTGVPASTLTSLAKTPFSESTINDLLMSGHSAYDLANASNAINAGKITVQDATNLLNAGFSGATIVNSTATGTTGQLVAGVNAGLDPASISELRRAGYNIDTVAKAISHVRTPEVVVDDPGLIEIVNETSKSF